MNRNQLLRKLRSLARKRDVMMAVDRRKGKGSHYRVKFDDKASTLQQDLNPGRIERFLKQLGLGADEL